MGGIFGGGNSYSAPQADYGGGGDYPTTQPLPWDYFNNPSGYQTGSGDYGGGGDYPTITGGPLADGGGGGGWLGGIGNWLGSEKGQRALQQLGGFSSGMLAGSAPSLQPRGFTTALAGGMQGLQQAGSQYYQDALHRAQSEKAIADAANLKLSSGLLMNDAQNATGLPPGYGSMPPVGQIPPAAPAAPAASGGDAKGTGPFSQIAPVIAKYESGNRHNIGWGGTDLSGVPLSDTGFPQWGGKPGPAGNSTAAGLYQITRSTWDPIARELGIKDFSPESQYKVAEALYQQRGLAPWAPYNPRLAQALGRGEAGESGAKDPALQVRLPIPSAPGATPAQRFADTPFQMPTNMAAGLGGPQQGVLPQVGVAPVPGAMRPQAGVPLASALRPPVAPAVTLPPGTVAAAPAPGGLPATAAAAPAGGKPLAVGDSIARGFVTKGGLDGKTALDPTDLGADAAASRNPQQVLDFIDTALKYDPDYFRGRHVVLSTGVSNDPSQIDRVPQQLARLKDAGATVTVVGVGGRAGKEAGQEYNLAPYNRDLQRFATQANAGFTGALPAVVHPNPSFYQNAVAKLGAQRGAGRVAATAPVVDTGQGSTAGGGGEAAAALPPEPPPTPATGGGAFPPGTISPIGPVTPPPVVGGPQPAPPPAVTAAPAPPASPPVPGAMATGGALRPPAAPAGAPATAAPAMARGTAQGMPVVPPEPLPPPPPAPATPAPAPGAAAAPPGPPPPPAPGAMATPQPGAPSVMPGAVAPPAVAVAGPPPPVPNLGQISPPGMGGIPAYNVEAARRAQVVANALAMAGRPVPPHIAELAALPNKAVEAQWAQQKELYGQQLQAARDQWKSMDESQKAAVAAQNGLTSKGYESELRTREDNLKQGRWFNPQTGSFEAIPGAQEITAATAGATTGAQKAAEQPYELQRIREKEEAQRQRELDTRSIKYEYLDENKIPRTTYLTPREVAAGAVPGQPMPPGAERPTTPAPGAATPAPTSGAAAPAGVPPVPVPGAIVPRGAQTGLAPGEPETAAGRAKRLVDVETTIHSEAKAANEQRADLEYLLTLGPKISAPGPLASTMQTFNRMRQSVFGSGAEPVASYEMAQQLMGQMIRQAMRQNDPNPTERQQQMLYDTMPTPGRSEEGFQQGTRHMLGVTDYKLFKQQALLDWQAKHDQKTEGFEGSFKMSALPFVVLRMTPEQRSKYAADLQKADPTGKASNRLADQLEAIRDLKYDYKY